MKPKKCCGVALGVIAVVSASPAEADWMQMVFDVRCVPEIYYFSLRPHWLSAPEYLQRPVVPTPTDDDSPRVAWDVTKLEALRKKGILLSGEPGKIECNSDGPKIATETQPDGAIVVSIDGQKALSVHAEWWTYEGKTRKYELVELSADGHFWEADFVVREFKKTSQNDRSSSISSLPVHFSLVTSEVVGGSLARDQIQRSADKMFGSVDSR